MNTANLKILSALVILAAFFLSIVTETAAASVRHPYQIVAANRTGYDIWYTDSQGEKKYHIGTASNLLRAITRIGIGITNHNLEKIPIGNIKNASDSDQDGLDDELEKTLGTNKQKTDSDQDGYSDLTEITNNYDPLSRGNKLPIDLSFAERYSGRIFVQVEKQGQAWYVSPLDKKRYFLYSADRSLPVLKKIATLEPSPSSSDKSAARDPLAGAAEAIRDNNKALARSYFTASARGLIDYTMNFLNAEGRLALGNILSEAKLSSSSSQGKTYTCEVYSSLAGRKATLKFITEKQADGSWLLANL